jgi:SsrA-binding protein
MKITNRQAPRAFAIEEKLEAGIVLMGSEVKAIRQGHADLSGAYVKIMGSEAYLVNARIYPYEYARVENYDEKRTRKLLLHKRQIIALKSRLAEGKFTLVPVSMYINHIIKLELALARGKKKFDKKRDIKKRDMDRQAQIELKNYR